jgi:hypothetical protein
MTTARASAAKPTKTTTRLSAFNQQRKLPPVVLHRVLAPGRLGFSVRDEATGGVEDSRRSLDEAKGAMRLIHDTVRVVFFETWMILKRT